MSNSRRKRESRAKDWKAKAAVDQLRDLSTSALALIP